MLNFKYLQIIIKIYLIHVYPTFFSINFLYFHQLLINLMYFLLFVKIQRLIFY